MGFMLRFMLGLALVLTSCSTLDGASSWRHIRQTSSLEGTSEAATSFRDATVKTETINNDNYNEKDIEKSKVVVERKPKTETSTEITVNTNNDNGKLPSHKINIEDSLEKPALTNKESTLKKESQGIIPEIVPENKISKSSRVDNTRSLNIDIHKYVSPDFHNKNNVYSFSLSPDTEKFTNMHNDMSRSTTSKLQDQLSSGFTFSEHTTSLEDDFDTKFHNIEDGVKQKLEYIDHSFAEAEHEFQRSPENATVVSDQKNDTTLDLIYNKFKNITNNFSKNKHTIRKEVEVELGRNVDFSTAYNRSHVTFDDQQPKDHKNKISVNQTEGKKSLLSNKIETESANSGEDTKIKWGFPSVITTKPTTTIAAAAAPTTTTAATAKTATGQKEHAVYVPYTKDNLINISKRGSTKFIDTVTTTTEIPVVNNESRTRYKQALASKENKTIEQTVLENQVYPVQSSSPSKNGQDRGANSTTEKYLTTEGSTLSLKLYTVSNPGTSKTLPQNETDTTTTANVLHMNKQTTPATNEETSVIPLIDSTTNQDTITESATVTTTVSSDDITTSAQTEITFSTTENTETTTSTPVQSTTNKEFTVTTYAVSDLNNETSSSEQTTPLDHSEADITTSSTTEEEVTTTSWTPVGYSDYEDRASSGRELKGSSREKSSSNHHQTPPMTITETVIPSTTASTKTTSDYRENIIVKQSDHSTSTFSTKKTEESSHEIGTKLNSTDTEVEDEGEDETEDEIDQEVGIHDHTTMKSRMIRPSSSESTPFIVPLNVSMMLEPEPSTDATTIEELGSDSQDDSGGGGPIAAIVISCIGAICLIVLAGLLFVMRKRHKRFNYGQRCTPVSLDAYSVDNVSVYNSMRRKGIIRASKRSYGNPAFDDPSSVSHFLNFPALARFASNTEGIATEFEEIPQVTAQMNELPDGCETKNRYANVIPLPETRVYLSLIDGYANSDYINANYVTGAKGTKAYYIACQAPMQNTIDDFWRMVWEQQSRVVLMLTHLFENGAEKCVDYLPPSEVSDCHRLFGDFQVTLKRREVKEKYVISSLQLKNMVSNSWREVTHLWYLGWPEKGVPSEANSLIAFLIEARSYLKVVPSENGRPKDPMNDQSGGLNNEQSPLIVHCSPGTGRTGTVIACDIAIREFELTRQVDIPKTVYRIRRDRASSVQTKEQYAFIYRVISLYASKLTGGVLDSL